MSEEIQVNYSYFSNGISTAKSFQSKIDEMNNTINTQKSFLTETTFLGPIAENSIQAIEYLDKVNKQIIEDISTIGTHLSTIYETYKKGDNDSLQALLQLTGTSGSAASILGTTSALETYRTLDSMLTKGKFTKRQSFTATNGKTLGYYVYTPTFSDGKTRTGLPMCVFLHGSGGKKNALGETFPRAVAKGMDVPGILLFPESRDGWSGSPASVTAAGELTRKVAQDYKVDMTRISAAGHSDGGYGVHELVSKNPNLFSCYLCYDAGKSRNSNLSVIESNQIPSWGFVGSNGVYNKQEKAIYDELESANPSITQYTVIKGQDHSIRYDFWTTTYNFNGQNISPIEWLFTTTKSTAKKT